MLAATAERLAEDEPDAESMEKAVFAQNAVKHGARTLLFDKRIEQRHIIRYRDMPDTGLFATEAIPSGTTIIIEKPLIVDAQPQQHINTELLAHNISTTDRAAVLLLLTGTNTKGFSTKPRVQKAANNRVDALLLLLSQISSTSVVSDKEAAVATAAAVCNQHREQLSALMAICQGQAIVATGEDMHITVLLYPRIGTLNHACASNTSYSYSTGNDKVTTGNVVTTRDVIAGEEIARDYTQHMTPISDQAEKRRILSLGWCFDCRCTVCTSSLAKGLKL